CAFAISVWGGHKELPGSSAKNRCRGFPDDLPVNEMGHQALCDGVECGIEQHQHERQFDCGRQPDQVLAQPGRFARQPALSTDLIPMLDLLGMECPDPNEIWN